MKGSIPLDTLISNVTVVTMNPKMDVLFGAYIAIEDGKIRSIERTAPSEQPKTIIDGTGMVAIPGLINCHTHLATSSCRYLHRIFRLMKVVHLRNGYPCKFCKR